MIMLGTLCISLLACHVTLTAKFQKTDRDGATRAVIFKILTKKNNYESFPWRKMHDNQQDTSSLAQRRMAYLEATAAVRVGGKDNRYHLYIKRTLKQKSDHIKSKNLFYSAINPIRSIKYINDFITDTDYLKIVQHSLFVLNRDTLVDLKSLRLA
jgi:hypothetical protein